MYEDTTIDDRGKGKKSYEMRRFLRTFVPPIVAL